MSRLSKNEIEAIKMELKNRISGGEIHTSSWISENNWNNTVFEPLYTKACNLDETASGECFGLRLWTVMMEDENAWSFGKYESAGIPIEGSLISELCYKALS